MKRSALLSFALGAFVIFNVTEVNAQKKTTKPAATASAAGYTKLASGLQYKIVKHGTGKRHPQVGDRLEMNIHVKVNDSTLFDSRKMNNNKPVPFQVQAPQYKGDPIEGFMKLVAGDSAVLRMPVDTLLNQGKQMMPGMKAGDILVYEVELVSAVSDSQFKKESQIKGEQQKAKDEATLVAYFKANNIKATRTASGLYYVVTKDGTGANAKAGQNLSVNYTGRLLGGKEFDSNVEPMFNHVQPFNLTLGAGQVIRGWDEGLALLNKGAKATLYIPSGLAYGSQDRSPSIPANSILVFDVEILDISSQADIDDKLITDYLDKNHIKATKTASGLYYSITKKGTGVMPAAGKKVVMSYTGKTLDGRKFDSNEDTAFHHVQPFEFVLGGHQVIAGWDEGIALLPKGTKATLYIPSGMAYGKSSPTPAIPANSVLLFDVEVVDVKE